MRTLLDRYLDGDLTEAEAAEFLCAVEEDAELEAELRAYEAMLAPDAVGGIPAPSDGFTDRVMNRIADDELPAPRPAAAAEPPLFSRAWVTGFAWAAALAVVFMLGNFSPRMGPWADRAPGDPVAAGPGSGGAALTAAAQAATANLQLVRLVFVPDESAVNQVAVAGSFNGWNPATTPMEKRGNAWIAQVVLPADVHEYMFVVDGESWVTDPLAARTRDDGFGRRNAVLDLTL